MEAWLYNFYSVFYEIFYFTEKINIEIENKEAYKALDRAVDQFTERIRGIYSQNYFQTTIYKSQGTK